MGENLHDLYLKYYKIKSEIEKLPDKSIHRRRKKMVEYNNILDELAKMIDYKANPENNPNINPGKMLDDFESELEDALFKFLYKNSTAHLPNKNKVTDEEKILEIFKGVEGVVKNHKLKKYKELPEEELGPNGWPKKGGSRKTSQRNRHSNKSRNIKRRK